MIYIAPKKNYQQPFTIPSISKVTNIFNNYKNKEKDNQISKSNSTNLSLNNKSIDKNNNVNTNTGKKPKIESSHQISTPKYKEKSVDNKNINIIHTKIESDRYESNNDKNKANKLEDMSVSNKSPKSLMISNTTRNKHKEFIDYKPEDEKISKDSNYKYSSLFALNNKNSNYEKLNTPQKIHEKLHHVKLNG